MSEIGKLSVILAFLASCYAVVSIAYGLRTSMSGPLRSGRPVPSCGAYER